MKRTKFLLIVFILLAGIVPPTHAQEEGVLFRFLNLISGTSVGVDVYRDGNVAFFGIAPENISAERIIEPGEHSFEIYAQNDDPAAINPLATLDVSTEAGGEILVIAWVQDGQIALTSHVFDQNPVPINRTRIELLHLSDAAPSITVTAQNNDTLFEDAPRGQSSRADAPAGTYQLRLSNDAGDALIFTTLNAAPGELETVFLFGISQVQTYSLTRQLSQHGLLRVVHAGRLAPPVDVYLNGELTFPAVGFAEWAGYTALTPGDYTIDIFPAGTNPTSSTPLLTDNLQLGITAPITAVLLGESSPRLIFNQDNHQYIGENQSRVRFVNAALDLLALEVGVEGGEPLIAALEYVLASRNRDIESGPRTLIFSEAGGDPYVTLPDFDFEPNHYYTFVVVGNGLVDGSVRVLALDWNWQQDASP